jgi:hypothetical protein
MPLTIVRCSDAGCHAEAESKIAAPWKGGSFSELKTYGYACANHSNAVIEYAKKRPRPGHFEPDESIGPIASYKLPTY